MTAATLISRWDLKTMEWEEEVSKREARRRIVNNAEVLSGKLASLHNDARTADFTFVVGKGDKKKTFPAHRDILSAWSEPLRALVYGPMIEAKERSVPIDDIDPEIFSDFLKYLYTGRIEIGKSNLEAVLAIAHRYDVPPLVDACLQFMTEGVDDDNVCDMLAVAQKYDHAELQEKFFKYINMSAPGVLKSEGFLKLPFDLVESLIQSDLFAALEGEILEGCIRWTEADTGDEKENMKRRDRLPRFISHIRWGNMTLKELFRVVRPRKLVPDEKLFRWAEWLADKERKDADEEFQERPREPPSVYLAATDNFADNTGIFWHLGTDNGKSRSYTNPIHGKVVVTMSSTGGSPSTAIADRDIRGSPVENLYGRETTPWICFDFKDAKVRIEKYFIAQDQDHYLRNWRLEGSNDGETWEALREHENDATLHTSHRFHLFDVGARKFWRQIRLILTGPGHNGATNFDITQMEFYGWLSQPPKR